MRVKTPLGPGKFVSQESTVVLGRTVAEAGHRLRVTRRAFGNLVNEEAGTSAEQVIRRSRAFSLSPEIWIGIKMEYDLARAEKTTGKIKMDRIIAKECVTLAE